MGRRTMIYEYFPDEYIQLQQEIATGYHPKLVDIICQYAADDIDIKLAQIASYCEIILDGDYTLEDRKNLCNILRKKLIAKRGRPDGNRVLLIN